MKRMYSVMMVSMMLSASAFAATYGGGSGTAADPYQIWTAEQFNTIGANSGDWASCFKLKANIDMSVYTGTQYHIIGTDCLHPFTGTFDGNNLAIRNLTYTTTSVVGNAGVFGCVDQAVIKNLGVENIQLSTGGNTIGGLVGHTYNSSLTGCYVTGSVSGAVYVGGLAGASDSSALTDCYATSSVSGTSYVGGLVGQSYDHSMITSCHASGAVSGSDYYAGGLAGENYSSCLLTGCYATGSVSGNVYVGGLAGINDASQIVDCYAAGNVNGTDSVGGLAGYNFEGSLSNCCATGSVVGTGRSVGGLVGANPSSDPVTACFWDIQTSSQAASAGGTGMTTAQMKTLSTFVSAGWNFVDVWGIGSGQTYPYLKPLTGINSADINYSGTVDLEDLAILAANWMRE